VGLPYAVTNGGKAQYMVEPLTTKGIASVGFIGTNFNTKRSTGVPGGDNVSWGIADNGNRYHGYD
jgi:hypothetical protein